MALAIENAKASAKRGYIDRQLLKTNDVPAFSKARILCFTFLANIFFHSVTPNDVSTNEAYLPESLLFSVGLIRVTTSPRKMKLANEANDTPQNLTNATEAKDVPVFISSSVELEVDNEALQVGSQLPKELIAATARAVSSNMGGAGIGGDVIYLRHGTYKGRPATLLAFKFRFQFLANSANRFSRAEIRVAFNPHLSQL